MTTSVRPTYRIRPLMMADIEIAASFEVGELDGWTREQLDTVRRSKSIKVFAVDHVEQSPLPLAFCDSELAGWFAYRRIERKIRIVRIVVPAWYRRQGVATAVVRFLTRHLFIGELLTATVGERNLNAQLFLRATDFRCVAQRTAACISSGDDLYDFQRAIQASDL